LWCSDFTLHLPLFVSQTAIRSIITSLPERANVTVTRETISSSSTEFGFKWLLTFNKQRVVRALNI
jgi:hypothetical protein